MIQTLLFLSLGGSILALILFALKSLLGGRLRKGVYYYLWLVVLLRFCLPISSPVSFSFEPAASPGLEATGPAGEAPAALIAEAGVEAARFVVPPPVSLPAELPAEEAGTKGLPNDTKPPSAPAPTAPADAEGKAALKPPDPWLVMGILWLAGAVLCFGWQVMGYLRFGRLVQRHSRPAGEGARRQLEELGGRNVPRLLVCPLVETPMLAGLLCPVIVLPREDYRPGDDAAHPPA